MKRNFTFLIAAVALLVSLAFPLGMWGQVSVNGGEMTRENVTVLSENFNNGTAPEWTLSSNGISFQGSTGEKSLQIASSNYAGSAQTPTFSALVGNTATLTFSLVSSSTSDSHTLTVTGNNCKVDGNSSKTVTAPTSAITVTIEITDASTNSTITFSAAKKQGCKIDDVLVYYTTGGSDTYTVTYNKNGNDVTGTVPVDGNEYESGDVVTVLGNTGNLAKEHYTFGGWCMNVAGTGTVYGPAPLEPSFEISGNTTLYAKWNVNTHNVSMPNANQYGSYSASATSNVAYGTIVTLTYTPATGYGDHVATWTVNGDAIEGNTFTMPDAEVTVTVSVTQYVQPTEFGINLNNSLFGTNYNGSASGITDANPVVGTKDNVTVTYAGGGNHYINDSQIRFYPSNNLKFDAPSGYVITGIVFTAAGQWDATISVNIGVYTAETKSWTGSAASVLFTGSGSSVHCRMSAATITLAKIYEITYADNLTNGDFGAGNPTTALAGDNITITTVPANGYHLSSMTYSYGSNTGEATINGTSGSFTMPAGDILVSAVFAEDVACTIYYSFNGTIVSDFTETELEATLWDIEDVETFVDEYANLSELGFTFVGWTVDPTNPVVLNSYTPIADVTLYAVFTKSTPGTVSQSVILDGEAEGLGTSNFTTVTEITENGFAYNAYGVKYQSVNEDATNAFEPAHKTIIGGKNGAAYIYNTTAFGQEITRFEVYANAGASTSANVSINFSDTPIQSFTSNENTWTQTLSNLNAVYDASSAITPGAKYFWFNINSGANAQVQLRITYSTSSSAPAYYTRIYSKDIIGYGTDHAVKNGWYLIASPVANDITPSADNGFITDYYDLYRFDQTAQLEWENHEVHGFDIESGRGYLYASSANTTLVFAGTPYSGDGVVPLVYNANVDYKGINLVGNPFATAATISLPYYKMNNDHTALTAKIEDGGPIAAMEGVFVYAYDETTQQSIPSVTFTASRSRGNSNASVNIDVMHNGANIDNAIVRFDEGRQLPKYQLFKNSTKLYITKNGKDYAIVNSEAQGEMPVNFKAEENGTYTLSINTENVEMNYLHLVDNMTGMDVDLLQTPSYTFDATTNDYTSRFRLVFSANDVNEQNAETFAFFSNGNWVVNNEGEATLQVIDVNGRIVSNETINGTVATSINATPGVYMLRLVNGNEVKTQKIVVK